MNYIATITSKRQLTIPSDLYNLLQLQEGERVLLSKDKDEIRISRFKDTLNRLAGSVRVPARFKDKSLDDIIRLAKKEHIRR